MLAGKAAIGIWNGIAPEGRADFYDWHMHEHIPERVAIPGFNRGRRYIAATPETTPEFFTLYEVDTFDVLQGSDYLARLNAPTPWTRQATSHFQNTARALTHVRHSVGPGMGGALLTIRFDAELNSTNSLETLMDQAIKSPKICGAHLCQADQQTSAIRTTESKDRTDITTPPAWFIMAEATGIDALTNLLQSKELEAAGAKAPFHRGFYQLEFVDC